MKRREWRGSGEGSAGPLRPAAWLSALCAALLTLLFASTSSPLYATNFWTDTNIYFTIGRGMLRGLMPYRDLFDHKGPLLYLIYAAGARLSEGSFLGVFALETAALSVTLRMAFSLTDGKTGEAPFWRLALIPLLAAAACVSRAFTQGGSAEEFCLPALTLGILSAFRLMEAEEKKAVRWAVAFGGAAALVFLIKYTDCGLFFGLGLFALLCVWRRRGFRQALLMLAAMAAGFALPVALTALWLVGCGALPDCVRMYFIQNLFDYSGTPMTLKGHIVNALAYLRTQSQANPVLAALTMAGMAGAAVRACCKREKGWLFEALALPAGAGLLLLFCYWGEMAHPYYALVFAATAGAGLAAISEGIALLQRRTGAGLKRKWNLTGLAVLGVAWLAAGILAGTCSLALPLKGVRHQEMPQTVFAEEMHTLSEAPTLLDLTSLDQGFYLAAEVLPTVRYFADNNLDTEEKREAISQYLRDRRCEFVVTVWRTIGDGYEVIDRKEGLFDLADSRPYTLWRRTEQKSEEDGHEDI